MTTATKEAETDQPARVWSFKEVEGQRDTLERVRARLAELAEREAELDSEIAEALAEDEGADVSELRAERRELAEEREDLSAACDVLEDKIRERREAATCSKMEELLGTVHKKVSGNAGEHPRRVERLEEARAEVVELEEGVERAKVLQEALAILASVAVDRADLPFPDWKTISAATIKPFTTDGRLNGHRDPPAKRVSDARRLLSRTFGDDSKEVELAERFAEVLKRGGERPLGAEESWKDKLHREREAAKEARDRALQEARQEIDAWLREKLRRDPISDQALRAEARREGFEIARDVYGRDLLSALRRVNAVTGRGQYGARLWGIRE